MISECQDRKLEALKIENVQKKKKKKKMKRKKEK